MALPGIDRRLIHATAILVARAAIVASLVAAPILAMILVDGWRGIAPAIVLPGRILAGDWVGCHTPGNCPDWAGYT